MTLPTELSIHGRARAFALGLMVFCGAVLTGCVDESRDNAAPAAIANPGGDNGGNPQQPDPEFDLPAMLTNLADSVFIPNYAAVAASTAALADATGPLAGYCTAIGTGSEQTEREAAQGAWLATMDDVQRVEAHALGPVLENGEALRNRLHSYANETISSCGIDQAAVLVAGEGFSIASRSINQRGMGAIEYLLFNSNLDHTCAPQVPTTQSWNGMSDADRHSARCALAMEVAADVASAAQSTLDRWQSDGGYRDTFIDAGAAGNTLQAVTDALFYLESEAKDRKLSVPLGLISDCSQRTCPDAIESPWSETSLRHLRANTAAFIDIFNGRDGAGFDDLIIDREFAEVVSSFQNNAAAVIAAIDANSDSLVTQVAAIDSDAAETACMNTFTNPDTPGELPACAVAGLLKRITDDLKIDFVTIVEVSIPGRVQSDND